MSNPIDFSEVLKAIDVKTFQDELSGLVNKCSALTWDNIDGDPAEIDRIKKKLAMFPDCEIEFRWIERCKNDG